MGLYAWLFAFGLMGLAEPQETPLLTFDEIAAAVMDRKVDLRSVDELLQWMQRRDPDYFRHFTLMRHSKSSQQATPRYPRAIVFGRTARMITTFNGHPKQEGYSSLEFVFQRETPSGPIWEFREIDFNEPEVVSAANPLRCSGCHYSPPRPIWSGYPTWPGAYGAMNDGVIDVKNAPVRGDQVGAKGEYLQKEFDDYEDFLSAGRTSQSRYAVLQFPSGSPVSPYGSRKYMKGFRPNMVFTKRLARRHGETLISQLRFDGRCYEEQKLRMLKSLLNCQRAVTHRGGIPGELSSLDWTLERFSSHAPYFEGTRYLSYFLIREIASDLGYEFVDYDRIGYGYDPEDRENRFHPTDLDRRAICARETSQKAEICARSEDPKPAGNG